MTDNFAKMRAIDQREDVCQKHGRYTAYRLPNYQREIWTLCPLCEAEKREASLRLDAVRARAEIVRYQMEQLAGQAAIPKRFLDRSFQSFRTDTPGQKMVLEACRAYVGTDWGKVSASGRCLCITGRPGTGKTHLAVGMIREILNRGLPAVYTTVSDVFHRIKESYTTAGLTEREAILAFAKPALLVIDEVGRQYGTQAERAMLFEVINARYVDMKPTVLVSNFDGPHLKEYLGDSIFSRLAEGGGKLLTLAGKDMRKEASHGLA